MCSIQVSIFESNFYLLIYIFINFRTTCGAPTVSSPSQSTLTLLVLTSVLYMAVTSLIN